MALRTYADRDGNEWRVWKVNPMVAGAPMLDESYRDGWLCFERSDATDRRRLSITEVPDGWASLPDEQLDLLRRVARPATPRPGSAGPGALGNTGVMETQQRDARDSGPERVVRGSEDEDSGGD